MKESLNNSNDEFSEDELAIEQVLRPKLFTDFEGQEKIVNNLSLIHI